MSRDLNTQDFVDWIAPCAKCNSPAREPITSLFLFLPRDGVETPTFCATAGNNTPTYSLKLHSTALTIVWCLAGWLSICHVRVLSRNG